MKYLGRLSQKDLFCGYLRYDILSQLGIKTIFVDSNQGAKFHENATPDYFADRFEDVLKGVKALI